MEDTALAVVDTSASVADTTSTALTTTTGADLAITDNGGDGGLDTGTDLATTQSTALENGKPSQSTRASLDLIKATNPKLAHAIPRAMAVEARLRSEFPGVNPFDAIKAMRREFKSLGGEAGIANIRKQLADVEEMDLLYAAGDPRMLDKMTRKPEGKAAMVKLAPHVLGMYEKLSPKAFTKHFATMFMNDMIGQRFDVALSRLAELIPKENTAAVAEIAKIDAYIKRLEGYERLQPETAVTSTANPEKEKLDQERKELAVEKRQMAIQGWKTAADADKSRIFEAAWAAETKGRNVKSIDKEDIQTRFWTRLPIALKQVTGFSDTLKEFFENDDKNGYLGYLRSMHSERIPALLRAEITRRLGPATRAAATAAPTTTTSTIKAQVDAGFKRIDAIPRMNEVDMRPGRTTTSMWGKKQAVLKNGDKVQWA